MEVRAVLPRSHRFNQFPRSLLGSDELCDCVTGPGEAAAGGGLHREGAGGRHPQYARHPRRLARRGRRGVQARLRHALPHCLLHRPLPLVQLPQPSEAAAPRRLCHAHCLVSPRFILISVPSVQLNQDMSLNFRFVVWI